MSKGRLFIVSAPSGTGKSTLVNMLLEQFPGQIVQSCSCTTRIPRPGEIEKKDYEFVSSREFEKKIEENEFLEYAKVFGNYYGTRKKAVEALLADGKHVVLVIDTQGALQLKELLDAVFIFIKPPSLKELQARLENRRTESEEKIQERLLWATQEISLAHQYDYQIVNDKLEDTYVELCKIIKKETP